MNKKVVTILLIAALIYLALLALIAYVVLDRIGMGVNDGYVIVVWLNKDVTDDEIEEIRSKLEEIEYIEEIKFRSKEEAYEDAKAKEENLEKTGITSDYFSASFRITGKKKKNKEKIVEEIETMNLEGVRKISSSTDVADLVKIKK